MHHRNPGLDVLQILQQIPAFPLWRPDVGDLHRIITPIPFREKQLIMVLIEFYKLNQIIFTQLDIPLTDIHADGTFKHTLSLFDSRKPLAFK